MLQAMLRGKLSRPEEGMEDLLTSNTFGLMKYLPPEVALLPFLKRAVNPLTRHSLEEPLAGLTQVESWRFWPFLAYPQCHAAEPDVEIVLSDGGRNRVGLFIEAKYRSGKSPFGGDRKAAPTDQLARELDNLRVMAEEEAFSAFCVIYVTASVACPLDDIRESARDYLAYRSGPARIYWVSWRSLPEVLEAVPAPFDGMAGDLRQLLLNMGLSGFAGLRVDAVSAPRWTFDSPTSAQPKASTSWAWVMTSPNWLFTTSQHPEITGTPAWFEESLPRPDHIYSWRTSP